MKVRATKASPGRMHIKVPGAIAKWIEPVGLDGKPGKWTELPDGNPAIDALVDRYHGAGHLEVEGRVTFRSFEITQCAGSPNCTEPIASKEFNLCYHHLMKLLGGVDKARTDEQAAVAEDKVQKAAKAAEKANASAKNKQESQKKKKTAAKKPAKKADEKQSDKAEEK